MAYIAARNWNSNEEKRAEAYTDLCSSTSNVSIASTKWLKILEDMETAKSGKVQIAKAFKDKPARLIQWIKTDSEVTFETYTLNAESKWKFQDEFIITLEALETFVPIHEYSMNIMIALKKEFSDEALSETSFLTRD